MILVLCEEMGGGEKSERDMIYVQFDARWSSDCGRNDTYYESGTEWLVTWRLI